MLKIEKFYYLCAVKLSDEQTAGFHIGNFY